MLTEYYDKDVVDEFFRLITNEDNRIAYGQKQVFKNIKADNVEKLLISDGATVGRTKAIIRVANMISLVINYVPTDYEEGVEFLNVFGIAAICKDKAL